MPSQEWVLQLSAVFFGVSLLSPEAEDTFRFTYPPSQLKQSDITTMFALAAEVFLLLVRIYFSLV